MTDRADRREEIKLRLEYVKLATSFAVIGTIFFAGLQWRLANEAARNANQLANISLYQRITNEWRDHLKTFVEKPELWPYFEGKKLLAPDDSNKDLVLALADIRLDVMDAILTYAEMREQGEAIGGWKNTFANAFRSSPVLCERLKDTQPNFAGAKILPIWRSNCSEGAAPRLPPEGAKSLPWK